MRDRIEKARENYARARNRDLKAAPEIAVGLSPPDKITPITAEKADVGHDGAGQPAKPRRRSGRGPGSLYKQANSRYWHYVISFRGKLLRGSTRETDWKKAMEVLKAKRDELAAARGGFTTLAGPEARRVRVAELLDRLEKDYQLRGVKSLAQVRAHLAPVREAFGHVKAVEVSKPDIDRYIADRLEGRIKTARKRAAAGAKVNRETQLLGQALREFLECHGKPVPKIRRLPENVREGFFERAEFEAVVAHLPEYMKDFARWGYLTGWRKSEIASLRWKDVDREGRTLPLSWRASKNSKSRTIALEGELWDIITRRWAARVVEGGNDAPDRISDLVFHRAGRPVREFRKSWASACRAAGLTGKLFHDLRRTAVRNMTRAGVDRKIACEISGHRTMAVFDRYDITDDRDIREAVLKTQAYVATLPTEAKVLTMPKTAEGKRQ